MRLISSLGVVICGIAVIWMYEDLIPFLRRKPLAFIKKEIKYAQKAQEPKEKKKNNKKMKFSWIA